MRRFLIVSKVDKLKQYAEIAKKFNVSFEINDFFDPDVLDSEEEQNRIIEEYMKCGIPEDSTLHGAFFDVSIFSRDSKIREISKYRMEQSLDIACRLGVRAVVFHTNYNPRLSDEAYNNFFVDSTVSILTILLEKYRDINIYLENMFDEDPYILREISKRLEGYNNFGVCFDWAHASIYGPPVSKWLEELGRYIKHIHINDNDLCKDLHMAVGSGKIDWTAFVENYERYFKACSVLIETNEPETQIESLEYINGLLGKYRRTVMDKMNRLTAEEMLEKIFYYMNYLVVEKDFSKSILLLTDLGRTLVNAERASFWYRDERKKQYWTLAASEIEKITIPLGSGIVGASIENNEIILINNPYEDLRFNPQVDKETGYITKSILCMPVTNSNGEVIGAYQAINKIGKDEKNDFDEQDIKRLALAAAYCGKILEAQILKEQNVIDQLTGLKNRRGFYDTYDNMITPTLNTDECSAIICDIDFFKKVNDTYGHNVGDAVLVHIADLMMKAVDGIGEVFRWGGEEFVILLPKYNLNRAVEVAESVRIKVKESECRCQNAAVKVTMSFGVTKLDGKKTSTDNIKVADDNLYRAKQEGRDRVIS